MEELIEALTIFKEHGFYVTSDYDGLGLHNGGARLSMEYEARVIEIGFTWRDDTREYYAHRQVFC